MRAFCLIREQPWYRRSAFVHGLEAAGHQVFTRSPDRYDKDTLLIIWNRYPPLHELALRVEERGGKVLVAENGYIGKGGGSPKFQVYPAGPDAAHFYALAESWHNGGGKWPTGDQSRWDSLGLVLKPWQRSGAEIVICPNRSFGVPGRMMPQDWAEKTLLRLRKKTSRPVRIRRHPGNNAPKVPLADDLRTAYAVVIWSSSAGVHALAEGIPVFCESPYWILKGAAATGDFDNPVLPDRLPHFQRLAWAQWSVDEIASGEPFRRLL